MRGFSLVLLAWACCSSLALWSTAPSAPPTISAATIAMVPTPWKVRDPMLLAIRDVESSGGTDCGRGIAGELTCWQVKVETARLMGCPEGWDRDPDGRLAAECAQRWIDKGRQLCRRQDVYGIARWYNRGRCMRWTEKPSGYEMDVGRARLKYL